MTAAAPPSYSPIFCLYSRAEGTGQNRGTAIAVVFISFQHQPVSLLFGKTGVHVIKLTFEPYWMSHTVFAFSNVLKLDQNRISEMTNSIQCDVRRKCSQLH